MKQIFIPFLIFCVVIILIFVFFGNAETYFHDMLLQAQEDKQYYSLLSFLILGSDIILPVPSSIIMHINGMVLGTFWGGLLSLFSVMSSSVLGYYLGKSTKWMTNRNEAKKGNSFLQKYGVFAIIISRGIPILSESIVLVCGYNRFNFRSFIIYSLIGYVPVCWIYAFFGDLSNNLFFIAVTISIMLSFIAWYFGKNFVPKNVDNS